MDANKATTIRVSRKNWRIINSAKEPGESMDKALHRLLINHRGDENKR